MLSPRYQNDINVLSKCYHEAITWIAAIESTAVDPKSEKLKIGPVTVRSSD